MITDYFTIFWLFLQLNDISIKGKSPFTQEEKRDKILIDEQLVLL